MHRFGLRNLPWRQQWFVTEGLASAVAAAQATVSAATVVAAMAAMASLLVPGSAAADGGSVVYAEMSLTNCRAELYLNGIPVGRRQAGQLPEFSVSVQQFLIDGKNLLELVINPDSTPSLARSGSADSVMAGGRAEARLVRYPEGVYPGDPQGKVLIKVSWGGENRSVEKNPAGYPLVVSRTADLGPQFGRWCWQDAPRLTLDPATRDSIAAVIRTVREALAKGDPDPIVELSRISYEEGARAYPATTSAWLEGRFRKFLARAAQKPGWCIDPVDPSDWDLRLVADGRLVECLARDWRPIVRTKPLPDDEPYEFPMLLGRIDGKWRIVR
jgi:hypothetical protein